MFKRPTIKIVVITLALIASTIMASGIYAQTTAPPTSGNQHHCVVHVAPLHEAQTQSESVSLGCFATFAEALAIATGGAVQAPSTASPEDITQALLSTSSNTVISIQWDGTNRGGGSIIRVTSHTPGCSDGSSYGNPSMEPGWDDRVSSAQAFGGCNHFYHYEHTAWTGAVLDCNTYCGSMGVMDNQTSSWRLTR